MLQTNTKNIKEKELYFLQCVFKYYKACDADYTKYCTGCKDKIPSTLLYNSFQFCVCAEKLLKIKAKRRKWQAALVAIIALPFCSFIFNIAPNVIAWIFTAAFFIALFVIAKISCYSDDLAKINTNYANYCTKIRDIINTYKDPESILQQLTDIIEKSLDSKNIAGEKALLLKSRF